MAAKKKTTTTTKANARTTKALPAPAKARNAAATTRTKPSGAKGAKAKVSATKASSKKASDAKATKAKASGAKGAKATKAKASAEANGLPILCAVFDALGWTYKVTPGEGEAAEFFLNPRGYEDLFAGVKAFAFPGRFVVFGVAPFAVPERHLDEAYVFASLVNNALQDGCVMVRTPAPAEVTFRTAVNFTRLPALDPGLVTGALSDLLEGAKVAFAGLLRVAEGEAAEAAFEAL